ncbi:EAL domain-containing protein [Streptomyces sp. D2-8]|uniref:putative bifunctional diguanylate cyclase/phosphodiesterase n=1 Tax=Streptomyces sp. D2-8 TaxID=2707767 RepID=UPI0020C0E9E7|nr:EAL domain-containing protein [Streptomyces sp. D2-8]MCK8432942.1 EAL domain-containing protein [Streptomyces sp. D2-8]
MRPPPTGRGGPARRLSAGYVVLIVILTVPYVSVPALRTPLWALIGLAGVAAVLTGVRVRHPPRPRPWLLLAAGLLAFTAGGTFSPAQEAYLSTSNPVPSWADACRLAVFPLIAMGLSGLLRYRWTGRDLPGLLDALVITGGLALPVWVYLVQPLARQEGLTWQQRAISVALPLGDILVLALLVRLLSRCPAPGAGRAGRLLVLGALTLFGFDIAHGILRLNGSWQAGTLLDVGGIAFCTAWGLAALHPSMARLTAPNSPPQSPLPPRRRLLLLAAATLIPPAILVHEESLGLAYDATVLAAFSGALFLLVILRLALMVVAHRRAMTRELALRTAAASLVGTFWPTEIEQVCDEAVTDLFGPQGTHVTLLLSAAEAQDLYTRLAHRPAWVGGPVATRDQAAEVARGRTVMVPVDDLGPEIAARLGALQTALLCPMVQPERPAGSELPGALLAAGSERQLSEMRGSLELLASQAGLATERIALRREVIRKENEAYFRTLVHNASDVILIVDDDTTVRYASPSAPSVFGSAELTGIRLPDLVDPRERDRAVRTLAATSDNGPQEAHDSWRVLRDTDRIEVEVRCRDLRRDPTVGGLVVTLRDVTEQRQLEQELTRRAFHDSLTGLPNRALLLERTERALRRGHRESTSTCLLFVDLDDFKIVNDTLGHSVGDRLLCAVAERLSGTLRRTDTAARLGGDEFAVLMEDAEQPLDAEVLAAHVVRTLSRPFHLDVETVSVSASVGVATAQDSTNAGDLLALADLALYAAKTSGKRTWRRFRPQQRIRVVERHDLQARLDQAVAKEQFGVRYQPVVDIARGDVVGFEALLRWPEFGPDPVPPGQFIPLAEETGHISALGAWVLRRATADLARLQHRTPGFGPPYLSVNVSARQWRDTSFLDEVCTALDTTGLAAGTLQLELTESVLMRWTEQIGAQIQALKDRGVRIAVDDFGTGFSSLRYLRDFPIDVLKIDKSFIDGIPQDPQQVALVEGIVHLADTLGLQVIAEGIEEEPQQELLADIGCRYGQGFLFARPLTLEQSEAVLRQRNDGRREAS